MGLRILIAGILIAFQVTAHGQSYKVNLEDRNTAVDLTNQANKLLDEKKADEAFALLNKAISTDSTYRNSYLCIYRAYTINRDYASTAIDNLKKAKRIYQKDDELCFYLGEVYRMQNNLIDAMNEYTAAIVFSKKNGEDFYLVPSYYTNRGNCYIKMEMYDSAIADYSYTLKLKPDNASALMNRGICYMKKGDTQNACADWTKSLETGNTSAAKYIDKHCEKP